MAKVPNKFDVRIPRIRLILNNSPYSRTLPTKKLDFYNHSFGPFRLDDSYELDSCNVIKMISYSRVSNKELDFHNHRFGTFSLDDSHEHDSCNVIKMISYF